MAERTNLTDLRCPLDYEQWSRPRPLAGMWILLQLSKLQVRPYLPLCCCIAALLFVAATPRLPYLVFVLLRFLVCCVCGYLSFKNYQAPVPWAAWGFGILAVFYNPLLPVRMHRSDWAVVNLLTAAALTAWLIAKVEKRYRLARAKLKEGRGHYDLAPLDEYDEFAARRAFEEGLLAVPFHSDLNLYLGLLCIDRNDDESRRRALHSLIISAQRGRREASRELGTIYEQALGVPRDLPKAVEWFDRAAIAGDGWSEYKVGTFFYTGCCADRDLHKAARAFKKAADKGVSEACLALGQMYANGEGVRKNKKKSLELIRRAAASGNEEAIQRINAEE